MEIIKERLFLLEASILDGEHEKSKLEAQLSRLNSELLDREKSVVEQVLKRSQMKELHDNSFNKLHKLECEKKVLDVHYQKIVKELERSAHRANRISQTSLKTSKTFSDLVSRAVSIPKQDLDFSSIQRQIENAKVILDQEKKYFTSLPSNQDELQNNEELKERRAFLKSKVESRESVVSNLRNTLESAKNHLKNLRNQETLNHKRASLHAASKALAQTQSHLLSLQNQKRGFAARVFNFNNKQTPTGNEQWNVNNNQSFNAQTHRFSVSHPYATFHNEPLQTNNSDNVRGSIDNDFFVSPPPNSRRFTRPTPSTTASRLPLNNRQGHFMQSEASDSAQLMLSNGEEFDFDFD